MNKAILSLSSTPKSSLPFFSPTNRCPFPAVSTPHRVLLGFRPICSASSSSAVSSHPSAPETTKHALLLEKLRNRHHKDAVAEEASPRARRPSPPSSTVEKSEEKTSMVSSFEELGLSEEVMGAVRDMGISVPTEIQCLGIPAVLDGRSVVLGSHTGSGKTLAYTLPIVQMLRQDEESTGMLIKPKRPRAVVLCPTRELSEQVFRVAKAIGHHARFRSTMVSGGGRLRPQADSLNTSVDMVVGTPGRVLQHIEEGNMVYGDIKYLVLDEADTMFDHGFGPDIRKFLGPLKNRASKSEGQGYQTVLVTATMSKAVQKLVDEEFHGITHIRTSSLHKKIASARHDFIKLSGSENKLDALLQILERSLSKGNRVMVFCNTLNSCRAVDHFLGENNVNTVNYHGQVPAEQRVENLRKFKSEDGECSALVCTDLAARGLDLDVDHVIMFDFPLNSIDYLHRTGRTARMGAKGNVTSLVARKDVLATQIEEAMRKNESLETLTIDRVQKDTPGSRQSHQKGKNTALTKLANHKTTSRVAASKPLVKVSERKPSPAKYGKASAAPGKLTKTAAHMPRISSSGKNTALTKLANHKTTSRVAASKPFVKVSERKPSPAKYGKAFAAPVKLTKTAQTPRSSSSGENKLTDHKIYGAAKSPTSKLSVVGFRGRSSLLKNEVSPSLS